MPLFLGIREIVDDASHEVIVDTHRAVRGLDPGTGAACLRHWVSVSDGKLFCLIEADDLALAQGVHTSVQGLGPQECHAIAEYVS